MVVCCGTGSLVPDQGNTLIASIGSRLVINGVGGLPGSHQSQWADGKHSISNRKMQE
jgi:hypothetical protein